MAPIRIEIQGHGETALAPELGVVNIVVEDKGEEQDRIVQLVQETTAAVQSQLQDLATTASDAPITKWSSDGMSTRRYDEYEYDAATGQSRKSKQVFEATTSLRATFRDFSRLSKCTKDLSMMPLVTVSAVEWILTPVTQKRLRAGVIKLAFDDAHEQAVAYADAAGRSNVIVTEIKDGEVQHDSIPRRMMAMAGNVGGDSNEQTVLEYLPEDVKYSTSCTVVFQAE